MCVASLLLINCVRACMRECVRVCVRVCVRACLCACVHFGSHNKEHVGTVTGSVYIVVATLLQKYTHTIEHLQRIGQIGTT